MIQVYNPSLFAFTSEALGIKVSTQSMCLENIPPPPPFLWGEFYDVADGDDNFSYFIQPFFSFKEIHTNRYPGNQS